jgi:GxxExxY protein
MTKQEYKDIYDFIGAAMEVHATLGRGMAEAIYQEAIALELTSRGMTAEREKVLPVYYKGVKLEKTYIADFYYKGIVIEMKSVEELNSDHRAQLFNYMRVSHTSRGILLNFGESRLRAERYVYLEEEDDFVLLSSNNYKLYISDLQ